MVVHIPNGVFGKHSVSEQNEKSTGDSLYASDTNENHQKTYLNGYEGQIAKIAESLSRDLSEKTRLQSYAKRETIPDNVAQEIKSLVAAAVKVGEVIKYFHDVANKTNIFALKVTSDALKSNDKSQLLALEVKDLADETAQSAEKIYSCMHSIQRTIVNIADERFARYKHMSVGENLLDIDLWENHVQSESMQQKIPQKTLNCLVEELDKLDASRNRESNYDEIKDFASQLHQQIDDLKKQLLAVG